MSPRNATERTVRSTDGDTASWSSTGEPSVITAATRSGCLAASARASVPPRLWPMTTAGSSNASSTGAEPVELAAGAADVEADAAGAHLVAAAAEPSGEHGQRGVAGQEPRDQQHGLPAVALLAAGGRGSKTERRRGAVANSGQNRSSYPSGALTPRSSSSCRMSLPVFSPRNSIRNTSGNLSRPPRTTSSREWSSPRRSHSRELGDALGVALGEVEHEEPGHRRPRHEQLHVVRRSLGRLLARCTGRSRRRSRPGRRARGGAAPRRGSPRRRCRSTHRRRRGSCSRSWARRSPRL